ncbi:MAG: sigma-70 family RNA polymerase sigma factor [Saprospiraceae bacterium]|jgi:RNA polymerase sigma factor (sigma-70 family)|nr:sigma-70 family RNA polymerase sigma factor [Saprospiraceae bacterium]
MNDLQLWQKLRSGDQAAFKIIYDTHARGLATYARKFTDNVELIEDSIHDLFVSIWQKREGLSDTDSIIRYMCVALRREIIRRISKSNQVSSFDYAENKEIDFALSVEDMMIHDEVDKDKKERLQEAFKELSSRQREAIFLKYYQEMSYEQICEVMDINYQSVRNLISKGIIELKRIIGLIIILLSLNL